MGSRSHNDYDVGVSHDDHDDGTSCIVAWRTVEVEWLYGIRKIMEVGIVYLHSGSL